MIDRAAGCLIGSAIGDAMGMPASFMPPEMIQKVYGRITGFLAPAKEQEAHGSLEKAEITDDTEESLIISEVLCEAHRFDEDLFINKMRTWALDNNMLGSTVIGPSTRRFLTAIIEGKDYRDTGKTGDTNGGAMRAAPIGIFYHGHPDKAAEAAIASALPSHGSKPGTASTAAVAAAVSLAVEGGFRPREIMEAAVKAAEAGEGAGYTIPAPSVKTRLQLTMTLVEEHQSLSLEKLAYLLYQYIGAGMKSYESIPLSLGIFYAAAGKYREGLITVINIGDDADTNGAITGGLCGAFSGESSIPENWKRIVLEQNNINFNTLAARLLSSRL